MEKDKTIVSCHEMHEAIMRKNDLRYQFREKISNINNLDLAEILDKKINQSGLYFTMFGEAIKEAIVRLKK